MRDLHQDRAGFVGALIIVVVVVILLVLLYQDVKSKIDSTFDPFGLLGALNPFHGFNPFGWF